MNQKLIEQSIFNIMQRGMQEQIKTFQECFDSYIDYSKIKCRPSTIQIYNRHYKYIDDFFKEYNIIYTNQVNNQVLFNMVNYYQKRNLSNNSINKYLSLIKYIFNHAVKVDIIISNPVSTFEMLPKTIPEIKVIDTQIVHDIFNYLSTLDLDDIHTLRNVLVINLFFDTGVRLNELLNIERKNIFLDKNYILLTFTKTKAYRKIFFNNSTKIIIEKYLQRISDLTCEYLFIQFQDNIQMRKQAVYKFLSKIKKDLNLHANVSLSPHKWRHTIATLLLKEYNIELVRKVLGHSSLLITQRYLHVSEDEIKDSILSSSTLTKLKG